MIACGHIITITGLVQGIGFRPFVYRLATEMNICGTVENNSSGIIIKIDATRDILNQFIARISVETPPMAEIIDISISGKSIFNFNNFQIIESSHANGTTTIISPDIAICDKCLEDRKTQHHRLGYPFINCTHCGPRFSIIKGIPYDRPATTMDPFEMCDTCHKEYKSPVNRRFHAQPIACNNCGPTYCYHRETKTVNDYPIIIKSLINDIEDGRIVALKSIGGYNLVCDANNIDTVNTLRKIKNRPRKPFAIMSANINNISQFASLSMVEKEALCSTHRPIVILDLKQKNHTFDALAPQFRTIGVMLPYMAIHYDIFAQSSLKYLVVTSGNEGNNPIIVDDKEALEYFGKLNIPILTYNREIYNRIDDSVAQAVDNKMRIIRRARGFTPSPIFNDCTANGVIGMGAEVISHFAIGSGKQIIESQYIGNISNYSNELFYNETLQKFKSIYNFTPQLVVVDAHLQYRASIIGSELLKKVDITKMWHHHAHAVAVMAEYGLRHRSLAICLDGTGLGNDNTLWGGELLLCTRTDFNRLYHLPQLPMPGGDIAAIEGWRMAIAIVGDINRLPHSFIKRIGVEKIMTVQNMIDSRFNAPLSSGAGRVFDAVASLLNVADSNSYEAEAPILLEQIADPQITEHYADCSYSGIINAILHDIEDGVSSSTIAARFHNSFVEMWINIISKFTTESKTIILCGGVFQNRLLANRFISRIRDIGLTPYFPSQIPCNDAAIAIGQVAYGAEFINQNN